MDVQVTAGSLVRTIAENAISSLTGKVLSPLQPELAAVTPKEEKVSGTVYWLRT